ncbi:MAG TPA: helix-turn-helix transcriptional regulator [Actinomycetota bacterium]|nr:helix-turn-helix transcriptional regulator [Actinomycetota bacterium]
MAKDLLDEIVEKRTKQNPDFPDLVEAAERARGLVKSLAERRRRLGLSQTVVAARMGTSQSALARLEKGETDPRITTVQRYALAVGEELVHRRPAARNGAAAASGHRAAKRG